MILTKLAKILALRKQSDVVSGEKKFNAVGCETGYSTVTAQIWPILPSGRVSPMVRWVNRSGRSVRFIPVFLGQTTSKNKIYRLIKIHGLPMTIKARECEHSFIHLPYWSYGCKYIFSLHRSARRTLLYQWIFTRIVKDKHKPVSGLGIPRWYPTSGSISASFDDVLVCASKSYHEMIDELEPWDLQELKPYDAQSYLQRICDWKI